MISFLIKLSENDKKVLLIIFFIVIILLVVLGMIYDGIRALMRYQGEKVDVLMTRSVKSGLITSPKIFKAVARNKSRLEFYRVYRLTFMFGILTFVIYGVSSLFYGHWINYFDIVDEGIATLFFIFDWTELPKSQFFGLNIISDWPPVISPPHFALKAIPSYILTPFLLYFIGATIYQVVAFIARSIKIPQIAHNMFKIDLKKTKLDDIGDSSAEIQAQGLNKPTTTP